MSFTAELHAICTIRIHQLFRTNVFSMDVLDVRFVDDIFDNNWSAAIHFPQLR